MARGLKFRIYEVEGVYYPCSEIKGADQLRGYREADLRLCFRICKKPIFSQRGSVGSMSRLAFGSCSQVRFPGPAHYFTSYSQLLVKGWVLSTG